MGCYEVVVHHNVTRRMIVDAADFDEAEIRAEDLAYSELLAHDQDDGFCSEVQKLDNPPRRKTQPPFLKTVANCTLEGLQSYPMPESMDDLVRAYIGSKQFIDSVEGFLTDKQVRDTYKYAPNELGWP